jgi:hypothetical protein
MTEQTVNYGQRPGVKWDHGRTRIFGREISRGRSHLPKAILETPAERQNLLEIP